MEPKIYKEIAMNPFSAKRKDEMIRGLDICNKEIDSFDSFYTRNVLYELDRHLRESHPFSLSMIRGIVHPEGRHEGMHPSSFEEVYAPFDNFFLEDYARRLKDDPILKADDAPVFFGLFLRNPHLTKNIAANKIINAANVKIAQSLLRKFFVISDNDIVDIWVCVDGVRLRHTHFPCSVTMWFSVNNKFIATKDGFPVNNPFVTFAMEKKTIPQKQIDTMVSDSSINIGCCLRFCQFLSIKNIKVKNNDFDMTKRQKRLNRQLRFKYHTLVVTKPGKQYDSTGGGDEAGTMPLHICRGHVKRYTEERPLFGRYAGTFYIPAHTRGKMENGIVTKDYSLQGVPK